MKIEVTDEYLPTNFRNAVRMLQRPYIPITASQSKEIEAKTKGRGDIFIYRGKKMTWGNADGAYALMPLVAEFQ